MRLKLQMHQSSEGLINFAVKSEEIAICQWHCLLHRRRGCSWKPRYKKQGFCKYMSNNKRVWRFRLIKSHSGYMAIIFTGYTLMTRAVLDLQLLSLKTGFLAC
uniref:Uncharacterized protein n=1 Tax=Salix viminalis TaxID=40686 RepID=A0A6N2KH69_SALVM